MPNFFEPSVVTGVLLFCFFISVLAGKRHRLDFDSFTLTAGMVAVLFVAVFVARAWQYPFAPFMAAIAASAAVLVGFIALICLAAALLIRVLSRKTVSLPRAMTIALFTQGVSLAVSEAYALLAQWEACAPLIRP